MIIEELDERNAQDIVESLRSGLPHRRYASLYSAGLGGFVSGVRRHIINRASTSGRIRFISGSWGSGKTHLFRLLTEQAFDENYLVSTVELSKDEAPFNKFEMVVSSILRSVCSDSTKSDSLLISPIGDVLMRHVEKVSERDGVTLAIAIDSEKRKLMLDLTIDANMQKVVSIFWDTCLENSVEASYKKALLMKWFSGDANKSEMKDYFQIYETLTKENARIFLGSVVALARFLGYKGLVIFLDESEMSHSTMARVNLKQAHNNLLHLINNIENVPGLVMFFAAVPSFFLDSKHGIQIYGALSARIGQPEDVPPSALQKVWNIDRAEISKDDFVETAKKIREIYSRAYGDCLEFIIGEADLVDRINYVVNRHGEYEQVSRWRAVVQECVKLLDATLEGKPLLAHEESYIETKMSLMDKLDDE